jgi:hypothetical protein
MVDAEVTATSKYVLHSVRTHKTTSSKSHAMKKWVGEERKGALNFKDFRLSVFLFVELQAPNMRWETHNFVNCTIKGICKHTGCSG